MVVVAGVERHPFGRAGLGDAAYHVKRPIAVERGDLDGHHVLDRRKPAPERDRQHDAADGWLQVEADQRDLLSDRLGMRDEVVHGRALEGRKGQQTCVVAKAARDLRLLAGLIGAAGQAGDHHEGVIRPFCCGAHRQFQNWRI